MNKKIKECEKSEIIDALHNGAYKVIAKKRKNNLIYCEYEEDTGELHAHTTYGLKNALNDNLGLEFRLSQSNHMRKARLKERISNMVNTNHAYFLTLTFNDSVFNRNLSPETRRRYIARFLKSECKEYVANIDFGSSNNREHYHAVVIPKTIIDFARYREIFDNSNINYKRIIKGDKDIKKVSLYIAKLTNHALKENGFYKRLIYSRNVSK